LHAFKLLITKVNIPILAFIVKPSKHCLQNVHFSILDPITITNKGITDYAVMPFTHFFTVISTSFMIHSARCSIFNALSDAHKSDVSDV